MPAPDDIRPFVERLIRDPGAALVDAAFARSFNRLPIRQRSAVMAQVDAARQRTRTVRDDMSVRPSPVYDGIRNGDIVSVNIDELRAMTRMIHEPFPPPQVIDEISSVVETAFPTEEELSRAALEARLTYEMGQEIHLLRQQAMEEYQRRAPEFRTTERFQMWSEGLERAVSDARAHWRQRIDRECGRVAPAPRPTPPVVAWPDPAEYGPGPSSRYGTQRGALSAFTRAVNNVYATRVAGGAWEEERDRIHINGTMEVRSLWRGWQEMPVPAPTAPRPSGVTWHRSEVGERRWYPVSPPPPPTTQPWQDEPATSIDDETDVMIKHLPRDRKFMVVVAALNDLTVTQTRLEQEGIDPNIYHIHTVGMMDISTRNTLRRLRYPIFIAPSVFKMHAARQGNWSEADLDALIELQGEIPDEETA